MNISTEIIQKGTGSSLEKAKEFQPYLNKYMAKYQINTPQRVMQFLAQIGVESASLNATKEYASGQAYEGRTDLGNTQSGDGVKFKGRGLIQVTGRDNYNDVQDHFGWNVIDNPELLEQPDKATEVSAWWWANRKKDGKYLSEWADEIDVTKPINEGNNKIAHEKITRGINGGTRGINERAKNFSNVQPEYKKVKNEIKAWYTQGWVIALFSLAIVGSMIILVKQLNKN